MADRVAHVAETVEAQRTDIDLTGRQFGQRPYQLLQRLTVGQPGFAVVQGLVGDLAFALADLCGHGVEAGGKPTDLVGTLDIDLRVLASGQATGGFVEHRDRACYAACQGPASPAYHRKPADAQERHDQQQRSIGRKRQRQRITQHQHRPARTLDRGQRLDQRHGKAALQIQVCRSRARLERTLNEAGRDRTGQFGRTARMGPNASGRAMQHRGLKGDCRQSL